MLGSMTIQIVELRRCFQLCQDLFRNDELKFLNSKGENFTMSQRDQC